MDGPTDRQRSQFLKTIKNNVKVPDCRQAIKMDKRFNDLKCLYICSIVRHVHYAIIVGNGKDFCYIFLKIDFIY